MSNLPTGPLGQLPGMTHAPRVGRLCNHFSMIERACFAGARASIGMSSFFLQNQTDWQWCRLNFKGKTIFDLPQGKTSQLHRGSGTGERDRAEQGGSGSGEILAAFTRRGSVSSVSTRI